jgi:hypothetical protein
VPSCKDDSWRRQKSQPGCPTHKKLNQNLWARECLRRVPSMSFHKSVLEPASLIICTLQMQMSVRHHTGHQDGQ